MNKILNMFKGFIYIGDKATNIKDKFVKKIDLHIEITKDEGYDVKVPQKKLQVYIEVFKDTFPECKIIL